MFGPINNDITIYPGSYVIDEMVIVNEATVTIKPGVTISFEGWGRFKRLDNAIINAVGTRDSIITFTRGGLRNNGIEFEIDNCAWCEIKTANTPNGSVAYFTFSSDYDTNYTYTQFNFQQGWGLPILSNVSYSNITSGIKPNSYDYQYNNIIRTFFDYRTGTKSNLLWERPGGLGSPQNLDIILNGTLWAESGNDVVIVDDVFVPLSWKSRAVI